MLAHESIYLINMNVNREETIKNYLTYLEFWAISPKDKVMSYEIPGRPWESVITDILTINNKHYLCIVDF